MTAPVAVGGTQGKSAEGFLTAFVMTMRAARWAKNVRHPVRQSSRRKTSEGFLTAFGMTMRGSGGLCCICDELFFRWNLGASAARDEGLYPFSLGSFVRGIRPLEVWS
jgi:hypothetical protein